MLWRQWLRAQTSTFNVQFNGYLPLILTDLRNEQATWKHLVSSPHCPSSGSPTDLFSRRAFDHCCSQAVPGSPSGCSKRRVVSRRDVPCLHRAGVALAPCAGSVLPWGLQVCLISTPLFHGLNSGTGKVTMDPSDQNLSCLSSLSDKYWLRSPQNGVTRGFEYNCRQDNYYIDGLFGW